MADTDVKDVVPKDPEPGEPGYFSPASVDVGVVKSQPNEVKQSTAETALSDEDYENMTVVELRELAHKRGVTLHSDMLKDDIIQALKKG